MNPARKSFFRRGTLALLCAALVFPLLAAAPKAEAQVSFSVQIGAPPVCPYGYFEYPPYACAPPGFYGPGYFYNGIFLGVGPWAHWGYAHGWGPHRFYRAGGGHYYPGYWVRHPHYNPGHRWDHARGHAYGHDYGHYSRGHAEYRGHAESHDHFYDHGHAEHHDNGHHGGDHGHGHDR